MSENIILLFFFSFIYYFSSQYFFGKKYIFEINECYNESKSNRWSQDPTITNLEHFNSKSEQRNSTLYFFSIFKFIKLDLINIKIKIKSNFSWGRKVFLLSNNYINELIVYNWDHTNEDITSNFVSFLKTISLKLNARTIQFFFNYVCFLPSQSTYTLFLMYLFYLSSFLPLPLSFRIKIPSPLSSLNPSNSSQKTSP